MLSDIEKKRARENGIEVLFLFSFLTGNYRNMIDFDSHDQTRTDGHGPSHSTSTR